MDVLAFMEAGFESCVSVPNGAVMKVVDGKIDPQEDSKFKFLWDAKKKIEKANRIIIATDSDGAGQAMAEEIARRIGKDKCWKVEFPEDCKDANDVLLKHGSKGLDKVVSKIIPWLSLDFTMLRIFTMSWMRFMKREWVAVRPLATSTWTNTTRL